MKKSVFFVLTACIAAAGVTYASAAEKTVVTSAQSAASADQVKNMMLDNAKASLQAKEWVVYMTQANNPRARVSTDVLTFKDGKVSSKNLLAQGYPESNFSLTLNADKVVVWETMQVNEKVGLAFLRGELGANGDMKGAMSMQPMKGEKTTYYFSTMMPQQQPAAVKEAVPSKKKGK